MAPPSVDDLARTFERRQRAGYKSPRTSPCVQTLHKNQSLHSTVTLVT
jgi:hypothetical protein